MKTLRYFLVSFSVNAIICFGIGLILFALGAPVPEIAFILSGYCLVEAGQNTYQFHKKEEK